MPFTQSGFYLTTYHKGLIDGVLLQRFKVGSVSVEIVLVTECSTFFWLDFFFLSSVLCLLNL